MSIIKDPSVRGPEYNPCDSTMGLGTSAMDSVEILWPAARLTGLKWTTSGGERVFQVLITYVLEYDGTQLGNTRVQAML